MSFSIASLIGAIAGATFGAVSAYFVVGALEERLRALDKSQSPDEKAAFERKIVLMRGIILTVETLVLGAMGFWLGLLLG